MDQVVDLRLRRAVRQDARAIGAVFDAAVRAGWGYLGDLVQEPMFAPKDWDDVVAEHDSPNVLLVAGSPEGQVLGFCAAHPQDGELYLLFVDPECGGRGVGRALLDAAHGALRAAGCRQAFLFTHEQNERALSFYASSGYRPDGATRESDFRGTALRELRLVAPL